MARKTGVLAAALLTFSLLLPQPAAAQDDIPGRGADPNAEGLGPFPYVEDQVAVKFAAGLPDPAWLAEFAGSVGLSQINFVPSIQWFFFEITDGSTVPQMLDRLRERPEVADVSTNGGGQVAFIPNDPYYSSQWYLPRMEVPQAWDVAGGGSSAPLVILDAGVNDHAELGYVVRNNFTNEANGDFCGTYGHGTFMAGIAAAFTNNSSGIAGIAYDAPIYSGKVIQSDGAGNCNVLQYDWIASGIEWAVSVGAKVINASFVVNDSPVIEDAVNYAWNSGTLIVAAAGNDGLNYLPYAPAKYFTAAAVGGTVQGGSPSTECRHPSSNYGGLDWVAPAENIVGTTRTGGIVTWAFGGTSSSAALSSGIVSLLYGHYGNVSPQQMKDIVYAGATDVCGQSGWTNELGYGRINAYDSL